MRNISYIITKLENQKLKLFQNFKYGELYNVDTYNMFYLQL